MSGRHLTRSFESVNGVRFRRNQFIFDSSHAIKNIVRLIDLRVSVASLCSATLPIIDY